jgi:hypothetical protein
MTTVYVVKSNNKVEGYATADVFSTLELAQEFSGKVSAVLGSRSCIEIVYYELDKPDYPFLKPRPFILTYLDDYNNRNFIGIDKSTGIDVAYSSNNENDAKVFPADTSKTSLLTNLERYFNFVNLEVEEV